MSSKQTLPIEEVVVVDLTHEGKGVAHIEGKTVFIEGALPGEKIRFKRIKRRRDYDEAVIDEILQPSADRIDPACPHFHLCGGCRFQHLRPQAQLQLKQKILMDNLNRIGHVQPEHLLPAVSSQPFGYRRRARLGVKFVKKKNKVLVGFREKGNNRFLAELDICLTLSLDVGQRLPQLAELIMGLDCYRHIPQIEVSMGDEQIALVFRHLIPLTDSDCAALIAFAKQTHWRIYLQPSGPKSVVPLWPSQAENMFYTLPAHNIKLEFQPLDFMQVNAEINQKLIDLALELLDVQAQDRVLDLFCGLGNFSLPLARRAQHVHAIEGDQSLVERGAANAKLNGLENVDFQLEDLQQAVSFPNVDKVLIDPPRCGAVEILPAVVRCGAKKIVYVSCNPGTLARDADILCHEHGMSLKAAGVLDMFPHTSHVESIALFEAR